MSSCYSFDGCNTCCFDENGYGLCTLVACVDRAPFFEIDTGAPTCVDVYLDSGGVVRVNRKTGAVTFLAGAPEVWPCE